MITTLRTANTERGYALLRIIAGTLFLFHGLQKVFGLMADGTPPVGSQIWIGGMVELAAGAAIAVGYFAHWAAFLACGTMAVAYIQFHWKVNFGSAFFPGVNKGELAVLYCFLFLFIFHMS